MRTKLLVLPLILLALTGCVAAAPEAEPTPTFTGGTPDNSGWNRDVTVEDFAAAYPQLDVDQLLEIDGLTAQQNGVWWTIGGSEGGDVALFWAREWVGTLEQDGNEYEGSAVIDGRLIGVEFRDMGGTAELPDAFILTVSS